MKFYLFYFPGSANLLLYLSPRWKIGKTNIKQKYYIIKYNKWYKKQQTTKKKYTKINKGLFLCNTHSVHN
jgi:hypothetical protein